VAAKLTARVIRLAASLLLPLTFSGGTVLVRFMAFS